jgi:hypothetical protein
MAIADDFTLDYTNKYIEYTGAGSTRYTVNALYSWLMDVFDDASQMDDQVPMSAQTPTEYTLINGWTFGDGTAGSDANTIQYLYGGSVVVDKMAGDDVWANFYTLGTIVADAVMYFEQNGSLVASYTGYTSGHIDQLIKVVTGGTATDDRKVTVYARNLGDTYDHFQATATATGGRNPVPIATAIDTNDNESGDSVVGVTVAFGTASKDIGDGQGAVNYDVVIDGGGNAILDVYRRLKYLTRRENTAAIDSPENTTEGRFYQSAGAAYAQVKAAPFGSFAGGKFFGARGVWVENISDPNNRELIDAAGVTHTPPTSITVSVTGVVSGDRVLLARDTAGDGVINKSQFTIASVTSNTIVATVPIPADVPTSGTIRVGDTQYTYSGVSSATFTGVSPNPTGETGGFYVPMIDAIASSTSVSSGSMIYSSEFTVVARVRKLGILPFENTGTVTSAGLTISAIRTSDSIVTV